MSGMARWVWRGIPLAVSLLLVGCAAGSMLGAGQGGRAADGRSYEAARADNLLVAAVNRALVRDQSVRATAIQASARDGIVTLTGKVPDSASATRVVQRVRAIDGVRGVVNHLRVAP